MACEKIIDLLAWCRIVMMTMYSIGDEEKLPVEDDVKVTGREGVVSLALVENFACDLVRALVASLRS